MPSTATLSSTTDHLAVSPVHTAWVFNDYDITTHAFDDDDDDDEDNNYDAGDDDEEEAFDQHSPSLWTTSPTTSSPRLSSTTAIVPYPFPERSVFTIMTVNELPSRSSFDNSSYQHQQQRQQHAYYHRRSAPSSRSRLTRFMQRRQYRDYPPSLPSPSSIGSAASPLISSPTTGSSSPWFEHSNCLTDVLDHLTTSTPFSDAPLPSSSSHYPLRFNIVSYDGGCYSSAYDIENVLMDNASVYCSGRTGTVNVLLRYRGGRSITDTTCVLTNIIIRSPKHGFTAPCKEGLIFFSHSPINIEETSRFDRFTKSEYDRYSSTAMSAADEDRHPIAWFSVTDCQEETIKINERSGKYLLIKLLRSQREQDNIDLQYLGFIGYSGARSFASPPRLY